MATTPSVPALQLFSLKGKTAIVTGASRGIGSACALALAEAGSNVCLVLRNPSTSPKEIVTAIKNCGVEYNEVYADLTDIEAVKKVFDEAAAKVKTPFHILVSCAGIQRRHPAEEFPEQDWDAVLNVNLKVPFLLAQAFARQAFANNIQGKVINFGSLQSYQGGLTIPAYASSKGGIRSLTQALSNDWCRKGINVNAICPGYVATDMNEALLANPTRLAQLDARMPIGRWAVPNDFKGAVVFLASDASAYVTGSCLDVDGGWLAR